MATIGTFIKRGDDLHGAIRTLTLDVDLVMRPIPKTKADSPDFLIYAAGTAKGPNGIDTQLGAGWKSFELHERETKVLGQLRHAGIPRLHAAFEEPAGTFNLVMQRMPGSDLRALVGKQRLSELELKDILVRALHANHFNRTATAAQLGISLRQIRYRIARLNIQGPQDDPHADAEH